MPKLQVSSPVAEELLARYVNQGQALIERASLVGDLTDYEAWRATRKQWIEQSAQALGQIFGGSKKVEEFRSAADSADGGQRWQQQYSTDLASVETALETLVSHQRDLDFTPGPQADPERAAEPERFDSAEHVTETEAEPTEEPTRGSDSMADRRPVPEPESGRGHEWSGDSESARDSELSTLAPEASDERGHEPARGHDPERSVATGRAADGGAEPRANGSRGSQVAAANSIGAELAPAGSNGAHIVKQSNGSVSIPDRMRQVFLAAGRDEKWMHSVAHLLEQAGPHAVTVLNERLADRASLTEEFQSHVEGSHYAVVLLTADDVGAPRLDSEEEPYYTPRARQGVVFEMGFLVAALTTRCVCVLYEDGVELPCDLEGIAYVRLDFAGTWQSKLLLHLRKAGFNYDLNRLAPV